jgi:hypothetical protein
MIKWLGKQLAERKVKQGFINNRTPKMLNLNEVKSVLLLYNFNSKTDEDLINDFLQELSGKFGFRKIFAFGFQAKKDKKAPEPGSTVNHKVFNIVDVNWRYELNEGKLEALKKVNYEVVFDFNFDENIVLKRVLIELNPRLLVGISTVKHSNLFDFSVLPKDKNSLRRTFDQLVHYLSLINKKTNAI